MNDLVNLVNCYAYQPCRYEPVHILNGLSPSSAYTCNIIRRWNNKQQRFTIIINNNAVIK